MKRFIINCSIFLVIFFVLEKALVLFRNRLPAKEVDQRLEKVVTGEINADIIVLGSSRGARSIIPSRLADLLNTSAFSLCYPGGNIFFDEFLLSELLKHKNKKPSLVILSVDDPSQLENNVDNKFRLDRLYPLVKYECIRNILIDQGEKNRVLSEFFIIHQLSMTNFDLRKKRFKAVDTVFSDGSMTISWQKQNFNGSFAKRQVLYHKANEFEEKVQSFNRIIKMCRENNIALVFAIPPNFAYPTIGFKDRMDELAGANNKVMMYNTANPIYYDEEYFFDGAHLKINGARVFTEELAGFIKEKKLFH